MSMIIQWIKERPARALKIYYGGGRKDAITEKCIECVGTTQEAKRDVPLIHGTVGSTVGAGTGFGCTATLDETGNVLPTGHPDKGKCRDCRACWDKTVEYVDYPKH